MNIRRDPNQMTSVSLMPIVVFGILALAFGAFMYAVFPQLGVLPPQASTQAVSTDNLFRILIGLSGVVFFLVQGLIYYVAIAFRAKAGESSDGPSISGNTMLEIVWTVVPSVVVVAIALMAFFVWTENTSALADDALNLVNGEPMTINAYGQRFAWSFEYITNENNIEGDTIVLNSSNLHTYVGQNMHIEMNSRDVIHSFWVPAMRVKQDVIPGRETAISFTTRDPQTGWEWVGALSPVTVYAEANSTSEAVFDVPAPNPDPEQREFPVMVEMELVNAAPGAVLEGDWTEVIINGQRGFVSTAAITGRFNRYRLICAELCGSGHGNMFTWVYLYENEEAFLNTWYSNEVEKKVIPPEGAVALGEQVLSGGLACANCHTLAALGWQGVLAPDLAGIANRADERAAEMELETGAAYVAQSLRHPNDYVVAGYNPIMPVFDAAQIPQDQLNGIVAYLCTQTDSGDPAAGDCGIENLTFDETGKLEDRDALDAELNEITGEFE